MREAVLRCEPEVVIGRWARGGEELVREADMEGVSVPRLFGTGEALGDEGCRDEWVSTPAIGAS